MQPGRGIRRCWTHRTLPTPWWRTLSATRSRSRRTPRISRLGRHLTCSASDRATAPKRRSLTSGRGLRGSPETFAGAWCVWRLPVVPPPLYHGLPRPWHGQKTVPQRGRSGGDALSLCAFLGLCSQQLLGLAQDAVGYGILCPSRLLHDVAQPFECGLSLLFPAELVLRHGQERQVKRYGLVAELVAPSKRIAALLVLADPIVRYP